ncbi:hypothetical protein H7J87_04140 [Mycolicibacterium wolinskyi]|uniref:DUF559 domain-containing protein n=1 Tax=Mycolicibacterium wolinskyi TaxID=59750 RepID=A0A1X2FDV2_9MYCO|nr:hypothetical protein [Mycolicibacterium wolinskyi]MCV7284511.1 hypothetical protein [Mycolicibacterium wolinskyi]MCV7291896.1 hypothetical protein [Mycolicibacterium goodii]ORX16594.1 hypothetical protein AWC31_21475 [Mycolicibacterium wolinskyi]
MEFPFIGSEAIAAGHLTRAHLRSQYRPLYRNVYVPRRYQASLRDRIVDGGAASPRETWLRLLFHDAGLPRLTTQFVVHDERGRYVRRIDMCWEQFEVGAEYDGEQHLNSRRQYVLDVQVNRTLQRLGWHVIHVIKEDHGSDIVAQARAALLSRGWKPTP